MKQVLLVISTICLSSPIDLATVNNAHYLASNSFDKAASNIYQSAQNKIVAPSEKVTIVKSMGTIMADNRANVFGLDAEGTLWTCFDNGHGWEWANLGKPNGNIPIKLSMGTSMASGRSNVFGLDADGTLWTCFDNGHGWKWANLGNANGSPIKVSMGTLIARKINMQSGGYTNVFGLDADGTLWTCFDNNHGWEWANLGKPKGNIPIKLSMGATNSNGANVFGLDADGTLWYCFDNGHGWEWAYGGKAIVGNFFQFNTMRLLPYAIPMGTDVAKTFALDSEGNLHCFYDTYNTGWKHKMMIRPGGKNKARIVQSMGTADAHAFFNVFGLDANGSLWTCFGNRDNNDWEWADLGKPNNNVSIKLSMGTIRATKPASYPKELNTALMLGAVIAGEIGDSKHKPTIDMVKKVDASVNAGDIEVLALDADGNLWTCFDNGRDGWQWAALNQPGK
jgi:hypothetical protein